jgi:excinuclease UvrABC nuclease subunit
MKLPRSSTIAPELNLSSVSQAPGLYWLQDNRNGRKLYVGQTQDLQLRLNTQVIESCFDFWGANKEHLDVRFRRVAENDENLLLGNQSHWIREWQPEGNYQELAAV